MKNQGTGKVMAIQLTESSRRLCHALGLSGAESRSTKCKRYSSVSASVIPNHFISFPSERPSWLQFQPVWEELPPKERPFAADKESRTGLACKVTVH